MLPRRLCSQLQRRYCSSTPKNVMASPFGTIQLPSGSLDQYVMEWWPRWEDKTAIECTETGRSLSYRELRQRSTSFASCLSQLGFTGRTMCLALNNCVEFPVALLGALRSGMSVSPADPRLTRDELRRQSLDSGARCVLTDPASLGKIQEAVAGLGVAVICTREAAQERVISFRQLSGLTDPNTELLPKHRDSDQNLALLPYPGTATGVPKGVRLSHGNIKANIHQMCMSDVNLLEDTTASHQDVVLGVLPFFHCYGTTVVTLRSLRLGAKIVSFPRFVPQLFRQVLASNKDMLLPGVPPLVRFLARDPQVTNGTLAGLRVTTCSGAHPAPEDVARLKQKKDHLVLQDYGLTEASPLLTLHKIGSTDPASIGSPLAGTSAKVVDPGSGEVFGPGRAGELYFKGPQMMQGYHNNPQATADTLDEEGWLKTGDIGHFDEEGNFFIVGEHKEPIEVRGFQF